MPSAPFTARFLPRIAEVDAAVWNALAGADYPFIRHEFLLALEQSGCVGARSGWRPQHMLISRDGDERPIACMPLYLKTNSMGEYVFDWSWADAYERHGQSYYPKLLTAIPFTPCAGPRLCVDASVSLESIVPVALAAIEQLAETRELSSWHLLFPEPALRDQLTDAGLLQRSGCQYQWFNADYRDFDHFLETFSSRKRKNLRKERARVGEAGIEFDLLEGAGITDEHWQHFFRFYQSTYFVRGRAPYLNVDFFQLLGRTMPERLLLVLARKDGEHIAGALFFKGSNTLYGRYWGCTEEYQFLHFETCYYQGIDYCIRNGIARFDSGAQGEHKIQRGFKPVPTWSAHWIRHPDFARAIAQFVQEEARHIEAYMAHASEFLPFRRDLELPGTFPALDQEQTLQQGRAD
ncbi:MAG: GNAT family N-acetyltransferase [Pseudomonadota bacterium]|nr:GNAT family N-acetyltransferase [Pseudomonadota bacterium]